MNATGQPKLMVALVLALIALTSAGHYLTPPSYLLWHGIFQRMYYVPVVFAAVTFGWRGGLAAAALSGLLYIPHILIAWSGMRHYAMEQYAEICMFVVVGLVTGVMSDRLTRANRELKASFEQVKRADRMSAIGQLAAGLAHEIRNPLASIDGAAEVMEAAERPEELRAETMGIIRRECARLNRLLTNLLDFARPRHPARSAVDVTRVMDSVIELVKHSAGKGIRFERRAPEGLPKLWCDEEQVAQVVLNLALNAAQAMKDSGTIVLSASEQNRGILLEVRDQGPGIAPEDMERIFDPFYTTKDGGTGLGLSVVHQIVTQHGGTVTALRNADGGMSFSASFPLNTREAG